jgi:hypothetical protein
MRTVKADLTPGVDAVNGSNTFSDSCKADTLVYVRSAIVETNIKSNLLLRAGAQQTRLLISNGPPDIREASLTNHKQSEPIFLPTLLHDSQVRYKPL